LGIGNRWANRHTGSVDGYTKGRTFVHVDIEPTQIGRVFNPPPRPASGAHTEPTQIGRVLNPHLGIVSDAKAALELFVSVAKEWRAVGRIKPRQAWPSACHDRKRSMLRRSDFANVPIKPQRVYQE